MKKFKEFLVFILIILGPIAGASAETKQGFFWTIFILFFCALIAWDAGMMDLPKRRDNN